MKRRWVTRKAEKALLVNQRRFISLFDLFPLAPANRPWVSEDEMGQRWTKLGRIEMDYIWLNLKNVGPPFFKFISVYIKMSFKQLENHSQLLCGRDSENESLLLCQFDV